MNEIKYSLSFKNGAFTAEDIIEIISQDLGFEKNFIELNEHDPVEFSEKYHKDIIGKFDELYLRITENKSNSSEILITNTSDGNWCQKIVWEYDSLIEPPQNLFSRLIEMDFFMFGYAVDVEYDIRQNTKELTHYGVYGIKPKGVKYRRDEWGGKYIDIRKNPGRIDRTNQMELTSAWKMWIGKSFLKYISKERVLSFPYSNYNNEVKPNIIEINLFDNPKEAILRKNKKRLNQFRKWINYGEIIQQLNHESESTTSTKIDLTEISSLPSISFGYKTTWVSVRTNSIDNVKRYFSDYNWYTIPFVEGVSLSYKGSLFISPAIDGWVLITSNKLPCTDSELGLKQITNLINDLSLKFDEAQYFSNYRVSGYSSWARSMKGKITRGFSDINGDVIWDIGKKFGIEKQYAFPHEKGEKPDDLRIDIPDEELVMELAGNWSIDPTKLDEKELLHQETGYISKM